MILPALGTNSYFSCIFVAAKARSMSEEPLDHIVYSRNVVEFVTVANEYCTFVEHNAKLSRREFVDKTQKLFPLLYLKAAPFESRVSLLYCTAKTWQEATFCNKMLYNAG